MSGAEGLKPICLPPGDYYWCGCGAARPHPLCDGRRIPACRQQRFTVGDARHRLWLCRCTRTRTPPWCDGTHNRPAPP